MSTFFAILQLSERSDGANQLLGHNMFKWTKAHQFNVLNWFPINRFLKFLLLIAVSQCLDSLKGAEHQEKEQTQKFQGRHSS